MHSTRASRKAGDDALRAIACWNAPWRVAHPSWLEQAPPACGRTSLARRMACGQWCRHLGLDASLPAYDGSIWWTLLAMPAQPFFMLSHLVGMVLVLAIDPRARLSLPSQVMLRARCSVVEVRWALQRSSVALAPPLRGMPWAREPEAAARQSACLASGYRSPALAARMGLRFPRPLEGQMQELAAEQIVPQCATAIEALWLAALEFRVREQGVGHGPVLQAA